MPYTGYSGYTGTCVIIPATHALTKDQLRELADILNAKGLRVRICTRLRDTPTDAANTTGTNNRDQSDHREVDYGGNP